MESIISKLSRHKGFDVSLCHKLSLDSFTSDEVVCSFTVDESLLNSKGTLHGGATATIIDIVGTLALLARDPTRGGVSLELNSSYLRAAVIGDRVICVGKVTKYGKSVGFTQVDLYRGARKEENAIASGRHTKYLDVGKSKL
jgi:acyl-coenzyme A thioesterase 13